MEFSGLNFEIEERYKNIDACIEPYDIE